MIPANNEKIEGLELQIDPNVQKLCETYNQSSGATRSMLYVMLIASIIGFLTICNENWAFTWPQDRISEVKAGLDMLYLKHDKLVEDTIRNYVALKKWNKALDQPPPANTKPQNPPTDSLKKWIARAQTDSVVLRKDLRKVNDRLVLNKVVLADLIKNDNDNNTNINISLIGVKIDVNDLSPIFGLFLIIFLFILRVTVMREQNNLRIALIAITQRYPPLANWKKLKKDYADEYPEGYTDEQWQITTQRINFARRKYHYNYLSMNEVFNLPYLDSSKNRIHNKRVAKAINWYLFYVFIIIYSYVLLNDYCTITIAIGQNAAHTIFIFLLSIIFYMVAFNYCAICSAYKKKVNILFHKFRGNDYRYVESENIQQKKLPLWVPALCLVVIISSGVLICRFVPEDRWRKSLDGSIGKTIRSIYGITDIEKKAQAHK